MAFESEFGDSLRSLRERRKVSRRVLSELCGLSKNQIGRYERGEREPKLSTLMQLADYFEVSVDRLLGHTSEPGQRQNW